MYLPRNTEKEIQTLKFLLSQIQKHNVSIREYFDHESFTYSDSEETRARLFRDGEELEYVPSSPLWEIWEKFALISQFCALIAAIVVEYWSFFRYTF